VDHIILLFKCVALFFLCTNSYLERTREARENVDWNPNQAFLLCLCKPRSKKGAGDDQNFLKVNNDSFEFETYPIRYWQLRQMDLQK
jgi:hypothetical protein